MYCLRDKMKNLFRYIIFAHLFVSVFLVADDKPENPGQPISKELLTTLASSKQTSSDEYYLKVKDVVDQHNKKIEDSKANHKRDCLGAKKKSLIIGSITGFAFGLAASACLIVLGKGICEGLCAKL